MYTPAQEASAGSPAPANALRALWPLMDSEGSLPTRTTHIELGHDPFQGTGSPKKTRRDRTAGFRRERTSSGVHNRPKCASGLPGLPRQLRAAVDLLVRGGQREAPRQGDAIDAEEAAA